MLILSQPLGFSYLGYTGAPGNGSSDLQTTAIDTTGADLLVVTGGAHSVTQLGTLSDSNGNTWTKNAGIVGINSNTSIAMYYSRTTLVGPNHIFYWKNSYFGGILVAAFKGSIANPADQNSSKDGVTPVQTPGIMPSVNVSLLVTACCAYSSNINSVDSGFTILPYRIPGNTGVGQGMAYLFQTTAAAVAPTWVSNASGGNGMTASTVSFKGQ
jgi:hypothetical protein